MSNGRTHARLSKELGLFDVYAISTGAMFSSGFFLLPGLAAAMTGPAVPFAYLVAALFILPAMFSVAELATAMPRAGGAYYFLDRSLGPLVGTVGGIGTWLALILKSAFALVGMGAYLALYLEVPIKPLAVVFTLVFMAVNIVGAKETGGVQRVLVGALLAIMALFMFQGLTEVLARGTDSLARDRFTPFLPFGLTGFMGTVGFVFVSYAGLTKVASVSEEIRNPDRNIPLGMMLSLATAAFVYTVGVMVIVAVVPMDMLRADLTPVATAAETVLRWGSSEVGVLLIVIAAIAAFASTGNAGILSASRYPLAMARDRLVSPNFQELGRFRTPTFSIVVTSLLIVAAIILLDVASIAKLASAFQLLLFALLNVAVVIMRESGIEGYDPAYRSPLYPWLQIFGILSPFWLITEMGQVAVLFTLALVAVAVGWYFQYGNRRVIRSGAIFHAFARLGALRYGGLDTELRSIVREKGLREEDPYDQVVARAPVLEYSDPCTLRELAIVASHRLEELIGVSAANLERGFLAGAEAGFMPVAKGTALPHVRVDTLEQPAILLARASRGLLPTGREDERLREQLPKVRAVIFLVSPEREPGQHLRLLGHLADHADDPDFIPQWNAARTREELRAALLRDERWLSLRVGSGPEEVRWAGWPIKNLTLPHGTLVALVRREGHSLVPGGSTVLHHGDQLTVIGDPAAIRLLKSDAGSQRFEPSLSVRRPRAAASRV